MGKIVELLGVSKHYSGQVILDKLDLNIEKGDIYGLIGRNGSGKTTLIRLITGLINPKEGQIKLFGIDNKSKEIYLTQNRISAIVESPSLYLSMTGYENMVLQAKLAGKDNSKIEELLKLVRLYSIANSGKKVKDYSLGMRQRLAIAVALINEPELLIMDEPANGLDPEGIREIRDIINNLHQKGITLLISSHLLDELSKVATKFGILNQGKIIKEIRPEELENKENPLQVLSLSSIEGIEEIIQTLGIEKYKIISNNRLVIPMQDSISPIINAFEEKGIKVLSIEEKKTTIEEYFLKLIGGAR